MKPQPRIEMRRLFLFAWASLLALVSSPALSQDRSILSDQSLIRIVITRHIEALQHDDAQAAFDQVSPGVREAFKTPENFLHIMQTSYRPVYRPASVTFLGLQFVAGEAVQELQLSDESGMVWLVFYPMQRQKDGTWKANGCGLMLANSISI